MDKKKIAVIVGITAVVVGGAFVFLSKDDSIAVTPVDTNQTGNSLTESTDKESVQITEPQFSGISIPSIEIDEGPFEDEPIEVDWEEPPVVTYYNEDADTNSDGHVEKTEWETWVSEHPEDLDQNMMVDDDELATYESGTEEEIMEYMPLEDVLPYTEEELEEIHAEGKEYVESQGGGLDWEPSEPYSTGNAEWDAIFKDAAENDLFHPENREGAVYDPETGLTHNPNVAIN